MIRSRRIELAPSVDPEVILWDFDEAVLDLAEAVEAFAEVKDKAKIPADMKLGQDEYWAPRYASVDAILEQIAASYRVDPEGDTIDGMPIEGLTETLDELDRLEELPEL